MNGSAVLALWVVFDRPLDFPRHVVVRCQRVGPAGIEHAAIACLYGSLAEMQTDFADTGLAWLPRMPGDMPFIVGVWL
jgi:hypothetical protein